MSSDSVKKARLAEALRNNLRRRKAQARATTEETPKERATDEGRPVEDE